MPVFTFYLLVIGYGMLNLIVGVIVESTIAQSRTNDELAAKRKGLEKQKAINRIERAFRQMDEDGSGILLCSIYGKFQ